MIFNIFCAVINLAFVAIQCDQDQITDTNLDILFILDQEQASTIIKGYELDPAYCSRWIRSAIWCYTTNHYSFTTYANYKLAYDGINSWVGSILDMDSSSEIHFAVVHSCSLALGGVAWSFEGKNFKEKNLLSSENAGINPGCKKNFVWTMNLTVSVFTTGNGRRPNASAVVIVVSDCLSPYVGENLNDYMAALNNFYQKVKGRVYFVCYDYKEPAKDYLGSRSRIFKNATIRMLENNGQSQQSMIYVTNDSAEVGRRLDELMPKRSGVKNVDCNTTANCTNCTRDVNGIGCHKNCSWVVKQRPTGTGKPCVKNETIFQQNCVCPPTTQLPTEGSKVLPFVLGAAVALLSAVAILTIVVCFVRAKRNKKRTKERAAMKGRAEKKAEVGVDLSTDPKSTHSYVDKGSKVKEMSNTGSVVQSVRKDVKSVSKPMGTTKLMASKSAAKKYAKSKGTKSVKSLMQKSANSKSAVSKNKIPANY